MALNLLILHLQVYCCVLHFLGISLRRFRSFYIYHNLLPQSYAQHELHQTGNSFHISYSLYILLCNIDLQICLFQGFDRLPIAFDALEQSELYFLDIFLSIVRKQYIFLRQQPQLRSEWRLLRINMLLYSFPTQYIRSDIPLLRRQV